MVNIGEQIRPSEEVYGKYGAMLIENFMRDVSHANWKWAGGQALTNNLLMGVNKLIFDEITRIHIEATGCTEDHDIAQF